jgi:hypothetical protein
MSFACLHLSADLSQKESENDGNVKLVSTAQTHPRGGGNAKKKI